jgi:class 3 adenylate cyclase/tetratricopeptide (TPR) repeat protein
VGSAPPRSPQSVPPVALPTLRQTGSAPLNQAAPPPKFTSPDTYTPKHLAEKILTSKVALEGERKQVTVLFADMKGSMELIADRDPEEARRILEPVIERMMEAVHHYEGTVNQVMGDGIMALFGAPLAHEDHAVRACYAALRMQEAINRHSEHLLRTHGIEVQVRVGLNSGGVVVGAIGSDLHMDYTAVGPTTHLAARLEQLAAPGSIRMSVETLRLAEGYVAVRPLGPVPIKGLPEPVEIYELSGAGLARTRLQAAAARGLTRFVGREAELETLRRAIERAAQGQGQIVALVGEPGVGKSRLFWEFTHSHRTQGWLILEAGSVSYGKATSYLPVIDLLRAYFGIETRDDPRRIRERLTGKLLTLDETLQPSLPAFLGLLDVPVENAAWQALDPLERRRRTLDAIKRLLLRESQVQPLCLVFEDLHWIDSETQALLDSLVESLPAARILLLVNYRPEYQQGWGSKTYYSQLRIDPLPVESAEELLRALLGDDEHLHPLRRLLIDRTEGNPFFLEESVRTLVETRALAGERGAYSLAKELSTVQVPATVQAILAARIDRLPLGGKTLLQTAAVIGKDVPYPLLQAIAGLGDEELRSGLGHLQAGEFLYEASLFPDLEYTFKHALTHEVTYGSLLHDPRRTMHARIVEVLERLYPARLTEQIEWLAHHAIRAETWERAVRYARQAGQKAAMRFAHREGAFWREQALGALGHLPDKRENRVEGIDLRLELRGSLFALGEISRTVPVLEEAERLAAAIGDRRRLGLALTYLGNYGYETTQAETAIEYGERAMAIARDLGDLGLEAAATFLLGQIHFGGGSFGRAIELLGRNVAALETFRPEQDAYMPTPLSVNSRCFLARALIEVGEFGQAATRAEEAIAASEAGNHAFGLVNSLFTLGATHVRQGDFPRAVSVLERGVAIARARTVVFLAPVVGAWLGFGLALAGRAQEGISLLEEAERVARREGATGPPAGHAADACRSARPQRAPRGGRCRRSGRPRHRSPRWAPGRGGVGPADAG